MEPEIILKEVIVSRLTRRGTGKDRNDPIRIITEVFEKNGTKIAEHDPSEWQNFTIVDLVNCARWLQSTDKIPSVTDVVEWVKFDRKIYP